MSTEWEEGFIAGYTAASRQHAMGERRSLTPHGLNIALHDVQKPKKRRKLSKWQQFVKANSKKSKYIYKSGAKKGKLNLKKMGVDYRKKRR